jgi:hypothetical protein
MSETLTAPPQPFYLMRDIVRLHVRHEETALLRTLVDSLPA